MAVLNAAALTREELAALEWYADLRDTSNAVFLPLFFVRTYWLVLMGGGGSGKSNFAADKVIERCVNEPGHRFLVVRKVFKTLRHSCFDLLCAEIERKYPDAGAVKTVSPLQIAFPNGSVILFAGCDDVEKLKSIDHVTSIWI
jgi:phage terminase large subunit